MLRKTPANATRTVIILLDPPFRAQSGDYGEIKDSVYNPIVRHLTPHAGAGSSVHPVPLTRRGIDLMAHYLTCDFLGQGVGIPSVSSVLRDLVLMISYEWTNVATYFERDLNTIEWRLERDSLPIEALAEMQQRLFSNRRRLRKYKQLLDGQIASLQDDCLPANFAISNPAHHSQGHEQLETSPINAHLVEARQLMEQNHARLLESLELIASLISVRQGILSLSQNRNLGFLALVATWALPFNVFAAVLGMQTELGYGQSRWNLFLILACSTAALLSLAYLVYVWSIRGLKSRSTKFD
ncbi:hypothetical protein S40293_11387 [Stachybotrys chartarum IBT 40293]|nr:hypothetical protein S40293_11387 [Stachybotrys chartarum IBT 40293]